MKQLFVCIFISMIFFSYGEERQRVFSTSKENSYDVLAFGAILADYFCFVTEEELKKLNLEKGSWKEVSETEWNDLYKNGSVTTELRLGGSALNVIKSLAHLGIRCGFSGKVGRDETALAIQQKLKELKIDSHFQKGSLSTGKALCWITPDGEKTMRTYLGISKNLSDLTFSSSDFDNVRLFHVEGYQIVEKDLLKKVLEMAKSKGVLISMDLGNSYLVRSHKADFEYFLKNYVDIVFSNEEEAKAFSDREPMFACRYLASFCPIAIVTMGKNGGWVQKGKEQIYFPAFPVKTKDTTGAGDFFSSGFLLGLLQEKSIHESAFLGAYIASEIVQEIGTDLSNAAWQEINARIKGLNEAIVKETPVKNEIAKRVSIK